MFEKYDPKYKKTYTKKPILFLHGEKDMIIPISGQVDFLATNNSNISFLKYEDVNHSISNKMKSDLINWLDKSL